jgi:chaperone required for assembly of F1-ATPase
MKKFYHLVAVNRHADGFAVLLDGKPVRTPLKRQLVCPTEALAQAIMAEWVAQVETIKPETMPLTQFMITFLDGVQDRREAIHAELLNYLDTDLVCYRAADPPQYAQAQKQAWDPIIGWFEVNFGVKLETTTEISPLKQNAVVHQSVETYVRNLNDYEFSMLQIVTYETGSLIIGIAFLEGAVTPEAAFKAAQVEELLKSEIHREDFYGKAPDVEKKQTNQLLGLHAARVFLDTLSA